MATEHYKHSDGQFGVRAYTELNRHGRPQHRVRYGYRGHPPCTDTAKSIEEAVNQASILWRAHLDGLLDNPLAGPVTVGDLLKEFVKRPELSPATKRSYEQACGVFIAHIGEDRDLAVIGKVAIEKWLATLTCKPVSRATYLRNVSAMFKWGKREKHIANDPTADVRVLQARAGHGVRPWLASHQWPEFLAACGHTHRIRAEFVLHTGLRAGELVAARWDWIKGAVGKPTISVPASKSARARSIPLDDRAIELLAEAKALWGNTGYLFGKDKPPQGNLRRDNVRACEKAKVTVCDFHGLRRSCASQWIQCGVDMFLVSRWLGHADLATTARHYAGLSDATSMAGLVKVNAALRAEAGDDGDAPSNVVPLRGPRQG
jgi:integrase